MTGIDRAIAQWKRDGFALQTQQAQGLLRNAKIAADPVSYYRAIRDVAIELRVVARELRAYESARQCTAVEIECNELIAAYERAAGGAA